MPDSATLTLILIDLRSRIDDYPSGANIETWKLADLLLDFGLEDADRKAVAHFVLFKLPIGYGRDWVGRDEIERAIAQLDEEEA